MPDGGLYVHITFDRGYTMPYQRLPTWHQPVGLGELPQQSPASVVVTAYLPLFPRSLAVLVALF